MSSGAGSGAHMSFGAGPAENDAFWRARFPCNVDALVFNVDLPRA